MAGPRSTKITLFMALGTSMLCYKKGWRTAARNSIDHRENSSQRKTQDSHEN